MRFGNLSAEHQADARAALLRGKEWNEEIRRIWNARTFVHNANFQIAVRSFPTDAYAASGFQRRFHRIVDEIDEKLIELVGVRLDFQIRSRRDVYFHSRFESDDAANPRSNFHRLQHRCRQLGKARVSIHETRQAIGARSDHREAPLHILFPVRGPLRPLRQSEEVFRHRLDRCE